LNPDDFKWENDYDHRPDAASMQVKARIVLNAVL
jgi:hypothetical protein